MKPRDLLLTRRHWLAVLAAWAGARAEGTYPSRPITLIVPFGPGGIADLTARAVAKEMSVSLRQPIVIDNRPSAGAIVGAAAVAQAEPDGHTVLLLSNANAVSAGLFRKLPFDVQRDFAPVTTLGFFDLALFVARESPWQSVKDVIAQARAKPGRLTVGTIASGSTQHLAAELFKSMAQLDMVVVPYKGTPAVITALRAGEIDLAFEILGPMLPQISGGALRALAVTSDRRFAGLPAVPTVQESGLPGYAAASWNALAVPARTPPAAIQRLQGAAHEALALPSLRSQLQALGVRAQAGSPEELRRLLASEIERWSQVIESARIERQ
ncbi:MAG TPA: tripartite tricarboxylate transporter substrate-binding protein [Burkholderiaceae bacterium]|nr:tripartite tricarboxylate transporter substrate-binding protein [Burkholderiaceae bacterium]